MLILPSLEGKKIQTCSIQKPICVYWILGLLNKMIVTLNEYTRSTLEQQRVSGFLEHL